VRIVRRKIFIIRSYWGSIMKKRELAKLLSDKYLSIGDMQLVDRLLTTIFKCFEDILLDGDEVPIGNICKLDAKHWSGSNYKKLNLTGQPCKLHDKIKLRCKPSRTFERRLDLKFLGKTSRKHHVRIGDKVVYTDKD
jgi:nucleoid DNA-binding protein